jgi:plasmid maintenance system antidote protein VapI
MASRSLLLETPSYNPDALLNHAMQLLKLHNDAGLAKALGVSPPALSKIRHRRTEIGAAMLIRLHEVTELPIRELRNLMGDFSLRYRIQPGDRD